MINTRFLRRMVIFLLVLLSGCTFPGLTKPPLATPINPAADANAPDVHSEGSIQFLDLKQGENVALEDGPLGPQVETHVEATNVASEGRVILQVDGMETALVRNSSSVEPFDATLTWWPWRGNGNYVLEVSSWPLDACCREAVQTITVHVTDFPTTAPTIQDRFIQQYQNVFGLKLTAPVFARYVRPWDDAIDASRWVSAAYIGDTMYEINLFDDGTSSTFTRPIGYSTRDYAPICLPAGTFRMLVVFVSYGNTGISTKEALDALAAAEQAYNRFYLELSNAAGASTPILQIKTTGAFLSEPTVPGQEETAAQISKRTQQDLGNYDILVEVDLDANRSVAATMGGLGFGGTGCFEKGPSLVDIYFTVDSHEALLKAFPGSVFDHELSHCLGWEHWWPNGDASVNAQFSTDWYHNAIFPTRMFGWSDADGDGIPEILDPTPYGLVP